MIKQVIALVVLSIAVVAIMPYGQYGIHFLLLAHDWVMQILSDVFSGGQAGSMAKGLIALLTIPIAVALVPTLIYWTIRRSWFPYFMEIVWIVWLIQAGALMAEHKSAEAPAALPVLQTQ